MGTVLHEIMCSEIPFLDTTPGLDSLMLTEESSTFSTLGATPDSELLSYYCQRSIECPSDSLCRQGVSKNVIDFVKLLMTVNPKERISAAAVLQRLWMVNPDLKNTNSPERNSSSPVSP